MSTREMYVDGVEERIAEAVRAERERVLSEIERLAAENYGPGVLAAVREIRTASTLR